MLSSGPQTFVFAGTSVGTLLIYAVLPVVSEILLTFPHITPTDEELDIEEAMAAAEAMESESEEQMRQLNSQFSSRQGFDDTSPGVNME